MKTSDYLLRTLVLAMTVAAPLETLAATTNGVILISTRKNQDSVISQEYINEEKGPGQATPGDVAMAALFGDNGYSCRLVLDVMLGAAGVSYGFPPPESFLVPAGADLQIGLAIFSGSSASADVGFIPTNAPLMMGEHVCLGNNPNRNCVFMYTGTASNDPNESTPATKYMKVINTNHPIMQGIPLDAQGRVKIWREAYPEEEFHVPAGGKKNFEYRWCAQAVADAAPGTTILGVLDGAEDRAVFAVVDAGGVLANGAAAPYRIVHMFSNENGSGGSRRVFLALTELGRLLFLRAAKWAMGETLTPHQSFNILEVSMVGPQRVRLSWEGAAAKNYRIIGTTDFNHWSTVLDDIPGKTNGVVSRTLDIAAAPQALYMRVASLPN